MKGILFKPDMIQAIIEGRKTQTRRVIRPQPHSNSKLFHRALTDAGQWDEYDGYYDVFLRRHKPRYQAGEVVYIKEAWFPLCQENKDEPIPIYEADWRSPFKVYNWRSPLLMPEKYARYFLKILSVRAERLQDITEEDCLAEGITILKGSYQSIKWNDNTRRLEPTGERLSYTARYHFEAIWDSINKAYPWGSNPWVWVYEFALEGRSQ